MLAVMNLADGVDVSMTESRVAGYQQEHYQEILENQARQVRTSASCPANCVGYQHSEAWQNVRMSSKVLTL